MSDDLQALRELQARYDSRLVQWRQARAGSQEIADIHASFKGMEREAGQLFESATIRTLDNLPPLENPTKTP